jgi:hypothetical protein
VTKLNPRHGSQRHHFDLDKLAMSSRFVALFALGCFTLSELAQAVNPPPDGGYPGFNTAEGQNALFNLTTGVGNAAVGWFSLWSNTTAVTTLP